MRPSKPSRPSARSMSGRLRRDFVAIRIGRPPASATSVAALASKASRSTTASGAGRSPVAAERRAAAGRATRRGMPCTLATPIAAGGSADAVDHGEREGLESRLGVAGGQRGQQVLRLARDGIRLEAAGGAGRGGGGG